MHESLDLSYMLLYTFYCLHEIDDLSITYTGTKGCLCLITPLSMTRALSSTLQIVGTDGAPLPAGTHWLSVENFSQLAYNLELETYLVANSAGEYAVVCERAKEPTGEPLGCQPANYMYFHFLMSQEPQWRPQLSVVFVKVTK